MAFMPPVIHVGRGWSNCYRGACEQSETMHTYTGYAGWLESIDTGERIEYGTLVEGAFDVLDAVVEGMKVDVEFSDDGKTIRSIVGHSG